jgi:hypothetical protein
MYVLFGVTIKKRVFQVYRPPIQTVCGKSKPSSDNVVYRASLWLKHLHSHWGTPRVHTGLQSRYGVDVPTIRTLNRWYKDAQLTKPRSKINRVTIGKSTAVHNIWQRGRPCGRCQRESYFGR